MNTSQIIIEKSYGIIPVLLKDHQNLKFLLIKAPDTEEWSFPKGHAELNESPIQAATRELGEETGITEVDIVPGISFQDRYGYEDSGVTKHKTVTFFIGLVRDSAVTLQSEEVGAYKWLNYEEASKILSFDSMKNMLWDTISKLPV